MKRVLAASLVALATVLIAGGIASAHECTNPNDPEDCHPTTVYPNWRGNRVPFFGLNDRENPEERREAQRWRDEWGCKQQFCVWADFSNSVNSRTPNEIHAGLAGDHSFLGEAAHQSEGHGSQEGNHDSHGGAIYADICLAESHDTSYEGQPGECDEGLEDNQVGLVVLDHNPCPACEDNYHLVRPLDHDCEDADQPAHRQYCNERMIQTGVNDTLYYADHPGEWACGYRQPGSNLCPAALYSLDGQVLPDMP